MAMDHRRFCLWLGLVVGGGVALAQQPVKGNPPRTIRVHVFVTTVSGEPVTDLDERDFSIWDDGIEKRITSFQRNPMAASESVQVGQVTGAAKALTLQPTGAYELTIDAAIAKEPNEYHSLGVKVDRPKLNLVARQGYYAHP
jgi:hypothetical protein